MLSENHKGLIEKVYSSINVAQNWQDILNHIMLDLDSTCAFIATRTKENEQPHSFYDVGFEKNYFERYQKHFFQVDLWTQALFNNRLNCFHANHKISNEKQFMHSEIYVDFARPAQIRFGIGALLSDPNDELITEIGIMRSKDFDIYDTKLVNKANAILPHIQHSIALLHTIEEKQQSILNLESILYKTDHPIIICKGMDDIIFYNELFETLLRQNTELSIKHNKLTILNSRFKQALFLRIKQSLKSIEYQQVVSTPFFIRIGEDLYKVIVKPWLYRSITSCGIIEHPSVMISFKPSASNHTLDMLAIQNHFDLTKAESHVCELLTQGYKPSKIAYIRGTSVATARQQIKTCMAKTCTSTQTQLVSLMLKLFLTV